MFEFFMIALALVALPLALMLGMFVFSMVVGLLAFVFDVTYTVLMTPVYFIARLIFPKGE